MKKLNEKIKEEEDSLFVIEDFLFLIQFENGRLIDTEQCILEFYYLLLCEEYDISNELLSQPYSRDLKEIINQMFIGDESNLIEHILMNKELIKESIKCALQRQLDGIA